MDASEAAEEREASDEIAVEASALDMFSLIALLEDSVTIALELELAVGRCVPESVSGTSETTMIS